VKIVSFLLLCAILCSPFAAAQEASSGFNLRTTLTEQLAASSLLTQPPRNGDPITAGFRGVLYPTLKMSDHWSVSSTLQLYTRPYFFSEFSSAGYGAKGNVLQASLNYSRISDKGSLLVRAGVLSSAFGSFLLRYDDADNALVNMPPEYGYYYVPVSFLGVAGAQMDATRGKWDARLQFANSSPVNPRSIFAHDQYGNWAGGVGYTIRQGLRVGVSASRGPYLYRGYPYFFPGEANPSTLPATGLGIDAGWERGHWSIQGELQKFVMPYKKIPDFRETAGYAELRHVLSPRWYVATRGSFMTSSATSDLYAIEAAAGYRPNRFQLVKMGYEFERYPTAPHNSDQTFAVQLVSTFNIAAATRH
jgi:hypothetical protein